jgi:hypothetical protein
MFLSPPLPIILINLDSATARLAAVQAQLEGRTDITLTRQPGVLAIQLPELACWKLGGQQAVVHRGRLGCFLAHIAAWERVAQGSATHQLIIEDDAVFGPLERIFGLDLPEGMDLIFCNQRMNPDPQGAADRPLALFPSRAILAVKADGVRAGKRWKGVGADGYLLSREGAKKLLQAVARDGVHGHVDARMLRYCLSEGDLQAANPEGVLDFWTAMHPDGLKGGPMGVLEGYCLSPSLVRVTSVYALRATQREQYDNQPSAPQPPPAGRRAARPANGTS